MFSKCKQTFFGYIPFLSPQNLPKEATVSSADKNDSPSSRISSQSIAASVPFQLPCTNSMLLDVFDCYCHSVIVESNQEQVDVRNNDLKDLRRSLLGATPLSPRINARFLLAEHAKELCKWQVGHAESPKEGSVSPDKFTTDDWKRLRDEWNEMRKAVVQASPDREQNDLLQEAFRAMQRLLHYQYKVAVLRWSLHKVDPTNLQEAIEMLENGWNGGEADKVQLPEQMMLSSIRNILEQVKKNGPAFDMDQCLQRCQDLLFGNESSEEYSRARLKHTMHALIIRWSKSILGTPTLFHLWCAGAAVYAIQPPEKNDASSFGDRDEAKLLSENEGEADEQVTESFDDNMQDSDSNSDEEMDYQETRPSVATQKDQLHQQRYAASNRVFLSPVRPELLYDCTQTQESDTQGPNSRTENNQKNETRASDSGQSAFTTGNRYVDENAAVHKERKPKSRMDSSDDDAPKGPKKPRTCTHGSESDAEASNSGVQTNREVYQTSKTNSSRSTCARGHRIAKASFLRMNPSDASDDDHDELPKTQHPSPPPPVLPSVQLPSYEQMQLDVVDYWCQAVISETDPQQLASSKRKLHTAPGALPVTPPRNLRIDARLKMVDCAEHLLDLQSDRVQNIKEVSLSACKFSADRLKQLQDEWKTVRQAVVLARPDHEQDDLVQGDFRAVDRLLHHQHLLAVFRLELHKDNPTSVQDAIEHLEDGWHGGDFLLHKDDQDDSLARIHYILKPVKKLRPGIEECLHRCQNLLLGDESENFSRAHLLHTMHTLINCWSEKILGIPTLCDLGYASVAPYEAHVPGNDGVSSLVNADISKHLSAFVGEADKQAAESIDVNIQDSEFNSESDDDSVIEVEPPIKAGKDDDSVVEVKPPIKDLNLRMPNPWSGASNLVSLSPGRYELPRACTQSQGSDTSTAGSDGENNQGFNALRMNISRSSNRGMERHSVNVRKCKKRRRKFSSIECQAIRDGIRRFGWGNWKQIKAYDEAHGDRLCCRDKDQINDKAYSMAAKGLL